jgi:hypothetical protein
MAIPGTWAVLLAAAIFGMNGHAQVPAHQGLTFNGDVALRNNHLDEADRTQAWLAASDQPEALVTGEYFYHLRKKGTLPAAHDVAKQDRLLGICERLSVSLRPSSKLDTNF